MNRQQSNLEILAILENYFVRYPDIRFGQALHNLNLATHRQYLNIDGQGEKDYLYTDLFYEESDQTLLKIKQT